MGWFFFSTLRHIAMFSPMLDPTALPQDGNELKNKLQPDSLSELPQFLSGKLKLNVPVYTIYGASEDITVVEKFKTGQYTVPNLNIIDENQTFAIETLSGFTIRLMGLGGNLLLHRFFDNGDGRTTIAGTHGLMWTTALQVGQLIQTIRKSFDASEIRIFVCHPCPSREALLLQLALSLRADFTISSGLHFIYGSSFNEYSVNATFDQFKHKLSVARHQFMEIWDVVKKQVTTLVENEPKQKLLLNTCLDVIEKMPSSNKPSQGDDNTNEYLLAAYRNMWNYNLCDAQFGCTVLNVINGRVMMESKSNGFDFQYRKKQASATSSNTSSSTSTSTSTTTSSTPAQTAAPVATVPAIPTGPKSSRLVAKPRPIGSNGKLKSEEEIVKPEEEKEKEEKEKEKEKEEKEKEKEEDEGPGIWVANGHVGASEIREYFAEQDRSLITKLSIKETFANRDKKFALVYFSTEDEAKQAMDRINTEKSGRVSLISFHHHAAHRVFPRRGGFLRGSMRGRIRGASRGGFRARSESKDKDTKEKLVE